MQCLELKNFKTIFNSQHDILHRLVAIGVICHVFKFSKLFFYYEMTHYRVWMEQSV